MPQPNVPALVKRLRKAMDLTQEQFAQKVGVTFSTVNQWENGRRLPQPFLLNKLKKLESAHLAKQNREREKPTSR